MFNGFKVVAEKERLNCLQKQSELLLNQQIQNVIAVVMIKYYDIIRQENYLKIIQKTLDISNKKQEIVNERMKVGMADTVDIMQSQIDVNIAKQNLMSQQLIINQAKIELLQIMNVKKNISFNVTDSIIIDNNIKLDSIINCLNLNPQYLYFEQQIKINEQIIKQKKAQAYPLIKLNAAYDFNNSNYNFGSILLNQNYGPSAGIILQLPIFNGRTLKTQRKVAEIELKNTKLQKENVSASLNVEAIKTFQSYITSLEQINSQIENYKLAKNLLNTVITNFSLNQVTVLDVKAAQASFEESSYLLVNLQYAAKVSEIELKQLVYKLSY